MDVKLSPFIVFFVCVTLGHQKASATIPEMTLVSNTVAVGYIVADKKAKDGDKTCTTKYTTCSLTFDGKPVLERGEKGDAGLPGFNGSSGIDGAKGDQGWPGAPGIMGEKGDAGEKGKIGPQGPSGDKGESGTDGLPGNPGKHGEAGENGKVGPAGPMGLPGPVGPPGPPGSHGVCPCRNIINCNYYLGPPENSFEVFCNMTTLETCIKKKNTTPECNHNPSKGAFWLNEMSVDMKELYQNITAEQFIWLRDRSDYVRETLKYNCLDSVPYSKHNMSSSVKLWASNDIVIGPYPTNQSPIFYSVPEATDECKEGSTEWKSTIIELQSSNVYRLPIVDIWIGDIRHADQKMSIESVELCFG